MPKETHKISITRKTFDGLCSYLQRWSKIYAVPGTLVLRSTLRVSLPGVGAAVPAGSGIEDATVLSRVFNTACCALGSAKVTKAAALLDLRDLSETDLAALQLVTRCVKLKPQQSKVMNRVSKAIDAYQHLPAMVKLALASFA